jgi:hypothetical protein
MGVHLMAAGARLQLSEIGVWRAISIQKTRHLDSIVAHALLVVDFIDSIGQKLTQSRLVG